MGGFLSCCRKGTQEEEEQPRGRRNQRSNAELEEMQEREACWNQEQPVSMATSNIQRKGKLLQKTDVIWVATMPTSRADLERQRREFWQTVAEFGGKAEIWTALKGVIDVWERDLELARTIIDCGGIFLPTGELTEVYDELGFRYVIPEFCLAEPTNLVSGPQGTGKGLLSVKSSPQLRSRSEDPADSTQKFLTVRLNTGADIQVEMKPTLKTIEDLSKTVLKTGKCQLKHGQRILFFYSGKGPLPAGQKLDDLERTDGKTPIQAWIS